MSFSPSRRNVNWVAFQVVSDTPSPPPVTDPGQTAGPPLYLPWTHWAISRSNQCSTTVSDTPSPPPVTDPGQTAGPPLYLPWTHWAISRSNQCSTTVSDTPSPPPVTDPGQTAGPPLYLPWTHWAISRSNQCSTTVSDTPSPPPVTDPGQTAGPPLYLPWTHWAISRSNQCSTTVSDTPSPPPVTDPGQTAGPPLYLPWIHWAISRSSQCSTTVSDTPSPPPVTDPGQTAGPPLYLPWTHWAISRSNQCSTTVSDTPSRRLLPTPVRLLVLPCTYHGPIGLFLVPTSAPRQWVTHPPSACYRPRSDCWSSLVPTMDPLSYFSFQPVLHDSEWHTLRLLPTPVRLLVLPCTYHGPIGLFLVPTSTPRQWVTHPPPVTDPGQTAGPPLYLPWTHWAISRYNQCSTTVSDTPSLRLLPTPVRLLVLPCIYHGPIGLFLVPTSTPRQWETHPPPVTDPGQTAGPPLYLPWTHWAISRSNQYSTTVSDTPSACYRPRSDCWSSLVPTMDPLSYFSFQPVLHDSEWHTLRLLPTPVRLLVLPCTYHGPIELFLVPTSAPRQWVTHPPPVTDPGQTAGPPLYLPWTHWAISRSSQCPATGVTKPVVCVILSVGWCI